MIRIAALTTTEVFVFYRKAVNAAGGDESAVDIDEFRYPGPRPQTRETAIMMIADSCESATRSIGPTSKQQVSEIVHDIVEMRSGQLDESGLTLNDLKAIQRIFVEMLQAVYHPRIDYKKVTSTNAVAPTIERTAVMPRVRTTQVGSSPKPDVTPSTMEKPTRRTTDTIQAKRVETTSRVPDDDDLILLDDDDTPMQDVPSLPRPGDGKPAKLRSNGAEVPKDAEKKETSE
jgi:hypothetical protein